MRETLTLRNACAIIILLQICNSIILGFSAKAGSDSWISILLSLLAVVPLMLVYGRLVRLLPGKHLFAMFETLFGRAATVVLCALYAFYFFTLAGIVRYNYSEFVHLTSLFHTPFVVVNLAFFVVSTFLAVSGAETLGKWSITILLLAVITYGAITLFSAQRMDPQNLLPLFEQPFSKIAVEGLKTVPLPMGECVAVLCLVEGLEKSASPYRVFVIGSAVSALILAGIFLQNCAVLGAELMEQSTFPSYKAASVLHVGTVGTRVESIVVFIFLLAGTAKIAACIIAASKAVAGVLRTTDHRPLLVPLGFLSVAFSVNVFRNVVEMFDFIQTYVIYALLFQVVIPLAAWITAEIKHRRAPASAPGARPEVG